jgi:hypothetical protein
MNTITFLCGLLKTWRPHSFTHDNLVTVQALLSNDDIIVHFEMPESVFLGQENAAFSFSVQQLRVLPLNAVTASFCGTEFRKARISYVSSFCYTEMNVLSE